ncbi:MAG: Rpn family recombination-promoting nuclease/putative transposase [Defluviitaleaceae bacterium]|nr:Rpn family recombination-promoting nuclease/putative transposase [Defluviitaleaceae bacterium]
MENTINMTGERKLLNLTIDVSFKYYFISKGSKEMLADFLSVTLDLPLEEFAEIELLNPIL